MDYNTIYKTCFQSKIGHRYITNTHIEPLLNSLSSLFNVSIIGKSVLQKSIYSVQFGKGSTKILIWSQMHGNESTTTKALFDLFLFLDSNSEEAKIIYENFTLHFIPILNPDGAEAYSRENANGIDLNRDAQNLSQPESVLLQSVYKQFLPNFCYNLHDQRTIYAAGNTNFPATVSFLAPSFNQEREINSTRQTAINLIVHLFDELSKYIPNQIGRFDDSFNLNCVGDTFQYFGTPTILFEAGHFQNDYEREQTRKFIFIALLKSFISIYENEIVENKTEAYLLIPQNNVKFYDFVYKNVRINNDSLKIICNFAAQFDEILKNNKVKFEANFVKTDFENFIGHVEYDAENGLYFDDFNNYPNENQKANFSINNQYFFKNGKLQH